MPKNTDVMLKDAETRLRNAAHGKGGKVHKRRRNFRRLLQGLHLSPETVHAIVTTVLAEGKVMWKAEVALRPDRRKDPFVNRSGRRHLSAA